MKRIFFVLLAVFFCALPAVAHTLEVRVVEVHDGKTLTVENTGRRFKVFLKIADAPEADQPYGDAARRHLSGLVLNRPATVEYLGLGEGAIIIGRVFCDNRDVGLQMIRDGVAWYDRKYESDLNDEERRVYSDSEQAARSEHRGIWQETAPVPPWEWRLSKATAADGTPRAAATGKQVITSSQPSAATSAAVAAPPARVSRPAGKPATGWPAFSPEGAPFSVKIPSNGRAYTTEVAVPNGEALKVNFYAVTHLRIGYVAMWVSGPYNGQAMPLLFDSARDALNRAAAAYNLPCQFTDAKDTPMAGYSGHRYTVQGCYFNGAIRSYYRIEGKTLKIRVVGVMSEVPNDPAISDFLESFAIN